MAMDTTKLAKHRARAATSLVIQAQSPTTEKWVTIGSIDSISRRIDRTTSRRRELDSDIPGETVEIIPGPSTITMTLRRAVLYKNTLLEAFGFDSVEDLIKQETPINIRELRRSPNDIEGTQVIEYQGCYFTSNPFNYDITRDWIIMQDVDVEVAKIRTSKTSS